MKKLSFILKLKIVMLNE